LRYAAIACLGDCTIAVSYLLRRFDRRLLITGAGVAVIILILAGVSYVLRPSGKDADQTFYTPGITPKREDCVIARMKSYNKLDKQMLQAIAMECELTVQSIEGHEKLRKAWEDRQATREATPKPAAEPAPPAEGDRLRRVWR
jgi:hypothetical protein